MKRGDLFALELLGSNGLLVEQKEWLEVEMQGLELEVEMLDFDLRQKKIDLKFDNCNGSIFCCKGETTSNA